MMQTELSFALNRDLTTTLKQTTLPELISLLQKGSAPVILDERLLSLYPELQAALLSERVLALTAGESVKTLTTAEKIYAFLLKSEVTRGSAVYVLGGGTVCDVAAYAVSTFKRGCRLVLVPTTLLAMVDAALGGKTALNAGSAKNLIGTFYPAETVLICLTWLDSLPECELRNGLAEMLKLRYINPDLPDPLSSMENRQNPELIFTYAAAKLSLCSHDPDDRGERRLLNLGHSFGHALESFLHFTIPHGETVAAGIALAAKLSFSLGYISTQERDLVLLTIKQAGFAPEPAEAIRAEFFRALPELLRQDKKRSSDNLTLILFHKGLQVFVAEEVSPSALSANPVF